MYLDEKLRNKVYFFIDKLRGGTVLKQINELKIYELMTDSQRRNYVNKKLNALLNDITAQVPFYFRYCNEMELNTFPVINKKIIAQKLVDFYSKKYSSKDLIPVHTSGSYGTPLTYYLTYQKKKSQLAEVVFYGQRSGYDVGIRHGYFRSNTSKSKFKYWMQNEVFFASKKLNDDFVTLGIKSLKEKKLKSLIGFPSAIAFLAKNCVDKGYKPIDFKVESVITSSENLTSQQREIINQAFNCNIHNRYSTEELGVLGHQEVMNGLFELNTSNYIFEVLKIESDESVNIGEIGRIVVTDLQSNAMPLIRYETGDLAVLGEFFDENKKWAKSITKLSGRVMQILYSTKGEILYPLYFDSIMDNYNAFSQYQIIQENEKEYSIKLVPNSVFLLDQFKSVDFLKRFHNWLGEDATIKIEFVGDIEKLPSGKRPYIINKYKQFKI